MASGPDPNPINLSLPWAGDLQLTNNGSLAFVSGIERVRQRIVRRYFTCPAEVLAGGIFVASDYMFDPNYGLGATRLVGQQISPEKAALVTTKIKNAVLIDEGVDTTNDPLIKLYAALDGTIYANVTVYLPYSQQLVLNFNTQTQAA